MEIKVFAYTVVNRWEWSIAVRDESNSVPWTAILQGSFEYDPNESHKDAARHVLAVAGEAFDYAAWKEHQLRVRASRSTPL